MVLTNSLKKFIKSLHAVKYRQKYNKFIAEGPKICKEFISGNKFNIDYIICTQDWFEENQTYLNKFEEKTIVCNDKDLKTISALKTPNKILIVIDCIYNNLNTKTLKNGWSYYLDRIQDPGNMGAILRIADWYGVENVTSSPDSVDYYNPKVVQSAMGAHNRLSLSYLSRESLKDVNDLNLIALCLDGEPLNTLDKLNNGVLIIGNESKGISGLILQNASHKITIPKIGGAESLNASVACGIVTHVVTSQK
ncbi:MAG: hypothetical protein HKO66_00890 [Saprospiraceae bacterium]|nr:hypothetical protein [Bacteroidia bacterium]NNL90763.1 hypothetical protein [Saprospiraceae bacterium]